MIIILVGVEESCFTDDMSKNITDALNTLSSIELKVLEYKILSGRKYSFNEIARILGISRYQVEKNYRTALVRLRNLHKELKIYL